VIFIKRKAVKILGLMSILFSLIQPSAVMADAVNNVYPQSVSSDLSNIPDVLKKINPSVVGIIGIYNGSAQISYQSEYLDGIAHGTGVIISSTGRILTNAHVVKDLKSIVVVTYDGKTYEGKLEAIDEFSDLATVKINCSNLTEAKFAENGSIYVGQSVLAIGTPVSMSFMNTVSHGIVSGINRGIGSNYRLIQTDAAINPGNSGGPLINMNGEIVGINSSKFVGASVEGMGFAIPVETIDYILNHFNLYGKVVRPNYGTVFEEDFLSKLGLASNDGISIVSFENGSVLQAAGAAAGDRLISINSEKVNSIIDLNEISKKYMPRDEIKVIVKRGNEEKELLIKLK